MSKCFQSRLASQLRGFLEFKRTLGYRYTRSEFTLLEFDRFLRRHELEERKWRLDQAMLAWLASKPDRRPTSVSMDAAVLRQFCSYLRRQPHCPLNHEPSWPQLPTQSVFTPHVLSPTDVKRLLILSADLRRPIFRASLYRMLLLVLYCTGVRFGEALQLRCSEVDTHAGVLFVRMFKGRARWVPFHRSLAEEMQQYLSARKTFMGRIAEPSEGFFVGANRRSLSVSSAGHTLQNLFRKAGLKPSSGRVGPRPYDLRHSFAVQRLSTWYREGVDLHARLPWLSAYMGHVDILGTETYLTATPELLDLAGDRLRKRCFTLDSKGGKL
jgi:site-specific recombinase XerD